MTTAQAATINRGQVVLGLLLSVPLVAFLFTNSLAQSDNALAKIVLWAGLAIMLTHALSSPKDLSRLDGNTTHGRTC